jgi:hypothetical protein
MGGFKMTIGKSGEALVAIDELVKAVNELRENLKGDK